MQYLYICYFPTFPPLNSAPSLFQNEIDQNSEEHQLEHRHVDTDAFVPSTSAARNSRPTILSRCQRTAFSDIIDK